MTMEVVGELVLVVVNVVVVVAIHLDRASVYG